MQLKDVKAIVTGAGRGMGAHFARRLVEGGAQVAAGDVDETALAELPSGIHKRRLDVRREAEIIEFVAWARDTMGGLNTLVNNAGIIRDGMLVRKDRATGEIKKMTAEDWRAVLDVNLTGATFMVREVVALMLATESRPGVVVNMSSISRLGNRGQSNYVSTKAALAANTLTWAREFAPHGVRVVAVAPGMIETPMTQGMNQKARDALVAAIPVGRIGVPEDIWQAVRFAIECEYVNGRTLEIDGGLTMT
ncbi:MAG TPA: SDR family oxidoreductase [Polyangiaceae bacterium]|jgi:3-oxoacyl-[acyl-carrier protein] reductase